MKSRRREKPAARRFATAGLDAGRRTRAAGAISLRRVGGARPRHAPAARSGTPAECLFDLPVGLVLAERVHGPDRRGQPADQRDLKDQADDARERAADREKLQSGQQQGEQKTHRVFLLVGSPTIDMDRRVDGGAAPTFKFRAAGPCVRPSVAFAAGRPAPGAVTRSL
ncbi:hypothetical protein BP354E_5499 [Burkholderia pseudomallei 354e]|uniref:Uncharacterized protein n=1 Tax=Burkholderia pseudomallei (strain 1026b) TaxID=884204 RepID=A0A0H3HRJ6_BURP2|nr:hypothetical protein BP1026B_II0259 [Burkholderia pseudomallei 1026b]EIF63161.1 hypothetical protein BP1026A_1950 [Burkholderia pseudomallei 1026a]EIF70005.1 hypothetical protein BP354E_5499 [Burkholderia pseudomallei 354e]EIF79203.1 hypothetical protein BP354A_3564 [Burkholderia pseudomallei 354a]